MSTPGTPGTPVVERVDARHRYEIRIDGELAGFTEYLDHDGQRVFYHTLVEEAFAGRGLAGQLVQEALTDVRAAGKRIVPICPYVATFLTKHREFDDLTDEVTPEVKGWLRARLG
ncbi:GNAT family N-acetyltransferase [Kitasatospora sp. NPDC089797]|uniref:GNAT family N-acetyltransferase n=1 Tax=Kitasatospora sp. NPDC089797 TaxID=3155298 RepID=UPI003413D4FF